MIHLYLKSYEKQFQIKTLYLNYIFSGVDAATMLISESPFQELLWMQEIEEKAERDQRKHNHL